MAEPCLDEKELVALVQGTLEAPREQGARVHVASCETCRQTLSELESTRTLSPEDAPTLPSPRRADEVPLSAGTQIGRYRVEELIGAGGMGAVYRAFDPDLRRNVALKLLRAGGGSGSSEDASRQRLLREAQAMARLAHPNVIAIHDVGQQDEQVFLAMELVDGWTLQEWLARERHGWREILRVFLLAGHGLAEAHAHGLVHRDFKPENVLVDRAGRVRVTDFGLAKGHGSASARPDLASSEADAVDPALTLGGELVGTPRYMAPEQFVGDPVDARTDQFAFCVALYEALYRERPFAGESVAELARAVLAGEVRPCPRDASVPLWVRRALLRGLAREPAARFPSLAVLLSALEADPARRWRKIGLWALAPACVLLGVLAVQLEHRRTSQLCSGSEAELSGVWDGGRRAELEGTFARLGKTFAPELGKATLAVLDRYADGWARMRRQTCEATRVRGEQTEPVMTVRMICLDRRREELAALVDVLSRTDPKGAQTSLAAAEALGPLDRCANVAQLTAISAPVLSAEEAAALARANAELARAKALLSTGSYAPGLEAIAAARAKLGSVKAPVTLGDLDRYEAMLALESGEVARAEERFLRSTRAYEEAGDDAGAAQAWLGLAFVRGQLARRDEALAALGQAEAKVKRLGPAGTPIEVDRLNVAGQLALDGNQPELAKERFAAALALVEKTHPDGVEALTALSGLGAAQQRLSDFAGSVASYERVVATRERVLGKTHPDVASALASLAGTVQLQGDAKRAVALLRRALAIDEAAVGESLSLAPVLNNLGNALRELGELDEAEAMQRRALAIRTQALGPNHPRVADSWLNLGINLAIAGKTKPAIEAFRTALAIYDQHEASGADLLYPLSNLGLLLNQDGRCREALPMFERAIAAGEQSVGPKHPAIASPLLGAGECLFTLGRAREAVPYLERAEALRAEQGVHGPRRASSQIQLARALYASDPKRAIALARSSRTELSDADDAELRALIDAFFAKHRIARE